MSTLRIHANPVRMVFSSGPWRAAWFLLANVFVGTALFSVVLTSVMTAAALTITLAGLPLLIAAAAVVRGCANAERFRLRSVLTTPVTGRYRSPAAPGMMVRLKTAWRDPAIWRDLAYLLGLWLPLLIVDVVVFALWLAFLAMISMPIWYRYPWIQYGDRRFHGYEMCCYFPNGPYGHGSVGVFVGSLPVALAVCAVGLAGFAVMNYLIVLAARRHARIAAALLRPSGDPLAEVRQTLSQPGPLHPFIQNAAGIYRPRP